MGTGTVALRRITAATHTMAYPALRTQSHATWLSIPYRTNTTYNAACKTCHIGVQRTRWHTRTACSATPGEDSEHRVGTALLRSAPQHTLPALLVPAVSSTARRNGQ